MAEQTYQSDFIYLEQCTIPLVLDKIIDLRHIP